MSEKRTVEALAREFDALQSDIDNVLRETRIKVIRLATLAYGLQNAREGTDSTVSPEGALVASSANTTDFPAGHLFGCNCSRCCAVRLSSDTCHEPGTHHPACRCWVDGTVIKRGARDDS